MIRAGDADEESAVMASEMVNVGDELRRMIADGRVSEPALAAIAGISEDALSLYLTSSVGELPGRLSRPPTPLSADEAGRLSGLAAQLTAVSEIDEDVRLKAIIETLTTECHLTHQNIALLTRTGLEDLERFLSDPASVSFEKKYELGIKTSYLLGAVANAAPLWRLRR
jgi:hypothetical protein